MDLEYRLPLEPLPPIPHPAASSDPTEVINGLRTEISYLQRKIKYLQSVSNIFRQRIGVMLKEAWRDPSALGSLHETYSKVVAEMFPQTGGRDFDGRTPSVSMVPQDSQGYFPSTQRISDVQKAHHLCLVLEEKTALKRRELELIQENATLRKALDGSNSNVSALLDVMRAENLVLQNRLAELEQHAQDVSSKESQYSSLSKQLSLAKSRSQKLKQELLEVREQQANEAESMQNTVRSMSQHLQSLMGQLREKDSVISNLTQEIGKQKSLVVNGEQQVQTLMERFRSLEIQQNEMEKVGTNLQHHHEHTMSSLMAEVQQKDASILDLKGTIRELEESLEDSKTESKKRLMDLEALLSAKSSLEQQVNQYEDILSERHQYANVLKEVQRRLNHAVDDLKQSQDCTTISKQLGTLETQLVHVQGLEDQIRFKDDVIAVKDDEICRWKQKYESLQEGVDSISTILLRLPHSIEEIEFTFIELEEYKSAKVPNHEEITQRAKLRQLELQTKRQKSNERKSSALNSSHPDSNSNALLCATMEMLRKAEEEEDDDVDDINHRLLVRPVLAQQRTGLMTQSVAEDNSPNNNVTRPNFESVTLNNYNSAGASSLFVEDDQILRAFQLFDAEGNGTISRMDVLFVLQAVGLEAVSSHDIESAWNHLKLPHQTQFASADQVLLIAREVQTKKHQRDIVKVSPFTPQVHAANIHQSPTVSGVRQSPLHMTPTPPATSGGGAVPEADIILTFQLFDEDGRGALTPEQAVLGFHTLGVTVPPGLHARYSAGVTLTDFVSLCKRSNVKPEHVL